MREDRSRFIEQFLIAFKVRHNLEEDSCVWETVQAQLLHDLADLYRSNKNAVRVRVS